MNRTDAQNNLEVRGAIDAFKQILEVMPDDLAALEALWRAYSDIGDVSNAIKYLVALANSLAEQQDVASAKRVLKAVRGASYFDPRVDQVLEDLAALVQDQSPMLATAPTQKVRLDVSEELVLVWALREAGLVGEQIYAQVASVLGDESRAQDHGMTAVHILSSRSEVDMDAVLAFLCKEYGTPMIDLAGFDVTAELAGLLPKDMTAGRQAMPFGRFGEDDVQIAILNPGSKKLRDSIVSLIGKPCHFFLCRPCDMDRVVNDLFS